MKPKQFLLVFAAPAALAATLAAGGTNELRTVRVSASPQATRVAVEFSRTPEWHLFTLEHPHRVVLDLRRTLVPGNFRAPEVDGVVTQLRSGALPNGGLRLVMDLAASSRPSAALLPAAGELGPQLVITLAGRVVPHAGGADVEVAMQRSAAPVRNPGASANANTSANAKADVAAPATIAASVPVRAAHAPGDTRREIILAIDAGHGGVDPGSIGRRGPYEKDVVLGIARSLARRINREPGMRAVLIRDGDYFLALRQRINKARLAKADMFVSIHADSVRDSSPSGASVYVLSEKGATNEQSRWLAERENAADLKGGVSLEDMDSNLASVLLDLSQAASIVASTQAAERVLQSLDGIGRVHQNQVQQAGFVVLKSPDIPSMLVETGYISNPGDEARLRRDAHRELLARSILSGVRSYFEQHPPDGTWLARDQTAADPDDRRVARNAP